MTQASLFPPETVAPAPKKEVVKEVVVLKEVRVQKPKEPEPTPKPSKPVGPIGLAFGPKTNAATEREASEVKGPITKEQVWDRLIASISAQMNRMEFCHLQEPTAGPEWADEYAKCFDNLKALYVLLVPLDRDKVEGFRLAVRKEIVKVENEARKLHDKLEVTRGNRLGEEVESLGLRHIRLVDQYEALSEALKQVA